MEAREKDRWSLVDIDEITGLEYKSEIKNPFSEANKDFSSSINLVNTGGLVQKKKDWPDKLQTMGDGSYRKSGEQFFFHCFYIAQF